MPNWFIFSFNIWKKKICSFFDVLILRSPLYKIHLLHCYKSKKKPEMSMKNSWKKKSFFSVAYCPSFHSSRKKKNVQFSFIFSVPCNCIIRFSDFDIRLMNKCESKKERTHSWSWARFHSQEFQLCFKKKKSAPFRLLEYPKRINWIPSITSNEAIRWEYIVCISLLAAEIRIQSPLSDWMNRRTK